MLSDDLLIEPFVDEARGYSAYLVASRAAGYPTTRPEAAPPA